MSIYDKRGGGGGSGGESLSFDESNSVVVLISHLGKHERFLHHPQTIAIPGSFQWDGPLGLNETEVVRCLP